MPKITTAVIPAAGFGTRFLPATKAQPKEMLTVVDKPVIQYVVEEAVAAGITDIIIITGQSKRAIEDHFDRNFELETLLREKKKRNALREVKNISKLANFIYIRQKELLGDGHAILQAASLVADKPFVALYGDEIIDAPHPSLKQVLALYEELEAPVITVTQVSRQAVSRYGVIAGEKIRPKLYRVKNFVEKPSPQRAPSMLANIGRCVVTPKLFAMLRGIKPRRGHELRLADVFGPYARRHPLYACIHEGTRYDCGDKLGLLKAVVAYGLKHSEIKLDFKNYLKTLL